MKASQPMRPWLADAVYAAVRYPRLVLGAWAIVAVIAGVGVWRLEFDTTTQSVLDRADPAWSFYQKSVERFGNDEIIVIAVKGGSAYDPRALSEVQRLTELAQGFPGVRRVDSLASFPLIRASRDGAVLLDPAMAGGPPGGDDEVARLADRVEADRVAPRNLVSSDGHVFAVNVLLADESDDSQAEIINRINEAIDPRHTWVSGVPVFRTGVNARTRSEILVFVPVTLVAIAIFLTAVFGSLGAASISLLASGAGTLVTLGTMGMVGRPVTISTMILPSILLALGSAYVMHVLNSVRGLSKPDALEEAVGAVANPIVLSGLTTAVGFVALSLIRIEAIRDLGGFGALGVLSVLASALTFVPAALRLWPLRDGPRWLDGWLRGPVRAVLVALAREWGVAVVGTWAAMVAIFSLGLALLQVETDAVLWFPHGTPVRDSYERIREELSGISPINVVIEARDGREVVEPGVLKKIDEMSRYLESLPEVGKAISLADPLAEIHSGITGVRGGEIPGNPAQIEEYLFLLQTLVYLDDILSWDRASANVLLRVDDNGSEDLIAVGREAEQWWKVHGDGDFTARATGIMHEFARSENEIAWGQLRGLGFALLAIGGLLFAIFRWPVVAAIAILPNVVPLWIVFGLMGLAGIPLDAVTVGLGSTALGIAVDDTIHLVSAFRGESVMGRSSIQAIDFALDWVLPPLVYTTIAIAGGFGILALSGFTVTQNLGLVTAGVVILCLLADLTLLPALLARLGPEQGGVHSTRV